MIRFAQCRQDDASGARGGMACIGPVAGSGLALILPLAQASRLDEMARHMAGGFRDDPGRFVGGVWWIVLVVLAAAATAVWILGHAASRRQSDTARRSPKGLFVGLCRAHGLTWGERRLLWRLARSQGLQDPARLFLEPERFAPANVGARLCKPEARLQAMRNRLFAGLSEEDAARVPAAEPSGPITLAWPAPIADAPPDAAALSTFP